MIDVKKVLEGLDRAADFIDEVAEKVETARQEADGGEQERTPDRLYGFKVGDEVVLIGPGVRREGERASVDPDAYDAHEGFVPVRRPEGGGDGFPARFTVLATALDAYTPPKPAVEPWYVTETPSGPYADWNRRVLKAMIDANKEGGPDTEVAFSYLKDDEILPTTRIMTPLSFRTSPGWLATEYVEGNCADADDQWRNFRLDRIQGYVWPVV